MPGLFLGVILWRAKNRHSVEMPTPTLFSASKLRSSASVISERLPFAARITLAHALIRPERRSPHHLFGRVSPICCARASKRTALESAARKPRCRLASRLPAVDHRHNQLTKMRPPSLCQACLPPSLATSLNYTASGLGILGESVGLEGALGLNRAARHIEHEIEHCIAGLAAAERCQRRVGEMPAQVLRVADERHRPFLEARPIGILR